ncbi:MAG: NUDIX hydrolase [Cyanobacteria bacterium SID2]|nr:NUDIX hydrolase [Cyanobacteria bacterium SID2]MBP0004610.1 NUDIX hydrolase [Cyanobacteria bacterium SBC]
MKPWETISQFVAIRSPWLTLVGERLKDDREQLLDYWRVEKADSAVVVTLHRDRFVFPKPAYRPGMGEVMLDFPGGRVPSNQTPIDVVPEILKRELGVAEDQLARSISLDSRGWPVNSSFSNQKLFGFVAEIRDDVELDPQFLHHSSYSAKTSEEIDRLLEELTCLQCRSVLLEWLKQRSC